MVKVSTTKVSFVTSQFNFIAGICDYIFKICFIVMFLDLINFMLI